MGYNYYYYSTSSANKCDTLICSGSGYEICKIKKHFILRSKDGGKYYKTYNKAFRKTEKYIQKMNKESGQLTLTINNQRLSVKFHNADKIGQADLEIEIL